MTMNRNWGYNSYDHDFESARELVLKLVGAWIRIHGEDLMRREEDSLAVLRRGEDLVVHLPRSTSAT